jgi:uroporphyrinogen decarboxylase
MSVPGACMSVHPPRRYSGFMKKRDVIAALLRKEIPDRVGLMEHFWPYIIENAWGAQGVECENWLERYDLDIRQIAWCQLPGPRPDLEATLDETDAWIVTRDGWGAVRKNWKKKAGTPEHVGFTLTSRAAWEKEFKDAALALDMRRAVDLPQLKKEYAEARSRDEFLAFSGLFVFEELRRIFGDAFMLESMLEDPELIHEFNELVTTKNLEFWTYVFREVGLPDGMYIYDDLGYTRGPFCSPKTHRELVFPYHRRLFSFFHEHHLPVILHTCGDFRLHLPALVEAGADCIQTLEAKTGMNVLDLASQYKDKLCFMGNIDVRALESGDRKVIEAEVLTKLNGMKALRAPYIFMSDHSVSPKVRRADYEYALELYHAHSSY